jgi:hypothetical protein
MIVIGAVIAQMGDGFHQGADASLMDANKTCKDTKALHHHAKSHLDTDAALADEIVQVVILVQIQTVSPSKDRHTRCSDTGAGRY